jgi:hypothetical protein
MPIQLAENAVVAGRFKLNRLIGRGGMGSVWQATHLGLDIPCAVKFIEGELSNMAEAQTRFEREAKAAAQLRSPHVVQILDHGVCEGTPYIAMELLDGEDLGKRLQKQGRMHPREVCAIMVQVTRALTKAHQLGIVHRDLKPDNIFLVRDDDREIAKVLDFGIAKSASSALEGSNTKTGAMLGTPYYMSPEQAQGIKTVDFRSDLWSLAVIVYQCVTGVLPFESEALGDLLMKIIVQPIPLPSSVAPDLPQGFDSWWVRASARDPNARFQGSKEFAESLQLVLGMSQLTDVMDRGQLKAVLGATPQPAGPPMPMRTPAAYGATTPAPGMMMAQSKFAATTGGAVTHPSTDFAPTTGVPKRGMGLALAGVGSLVVVAAIIGGVVMMRGHGSDPASAAAGPRSGAPAVVATPPAPQAPAPEVAAAQPPATPPAAPATPPADPAATAATVKPAAAANVDPPKHTHHGGGAAPAPKPSPGKPAPAKPGSQDMGF